MKKLKSYVLCAALSVALVLGICCVPALAAEDTGTAIEASEPADSSSESAVSVTDGEVSEDEARKNPFEMLWQGVLEHTEQIMCALALAGSLVLTFLYKKGLMPFLTRALAAIGSTLSGIRESTDVYAQKSGKELSDISEALVKSESIIGTVAQRLTQIEAALDDERRSRDESESLRAVMCVQVELLYDILMNSAIPQYRKDAAGERLLEMKSTLGALNKTEG